MKKLAIILFPLILMACSTTKPDISGAGKSADIPSNPPAVNTHSKPMTGSVTDADTKASKLAADKMTADKLNATIQDLQSKSIYFDFDQFIVKPEYRDVLQQQANFAISHTNDIVTIQGNADERGSEEYNLALGDRRANAARKDLELLGVPTSQIKTVSFGEEKPRAICHEENCWKENRRDDFSHHLSQ